MNHDMLDRIRTGKGFVAALDQSGGSTPTALERYGIPRSAWSDEAAMFDLVHAMRTRIMTSPVFTGERILAAILFEQTMDRQVEGLRLGRVPVGPASTWCPSSRSTWGSPRRRTASRR